MPRLRSSLATFIAVSTLMLSARTLAAQKVDVTGKWLFAVTTGAGTGTPTVTLKQQGDSLTGHYSSQALGEADLKGSVTNGTIKFSFTTEVQGTTLVVNYSGMVESSDALKGVVDIGGQATGTFTAKRQ
ncbi:MAG: hypothetical protein ABIT20_09675 [Gemmatimonadaceae bacterium]